MPLTVGCGKCYDHGIVAHFSICYRTVGLTVKVIFKRRGDMGLDIMMAKIGQKREVKLS